VDDERVLVRVYSTDATTAARECDLLKFLASEDVLVPGVLARLHVGNRPVAILEFIDGITLEDRLLQEDGPSPLVYREIGRQLATIHRITFAETGFLGPHLQVGHEYDNFSVFLKQFIERTLSMLLTRPDRLSPEINARLGRLVHDRWELVTETEPRRQLVHCDFNPKNLLVPVGPASTLLAVIDWEFCLSGNGLGDLGNFFRFECDYPEVARGEFAAGYRSVEPDLPANWFDVARLMDLGNMCSFLERPEDYQKSFRTARTVMQSTLMHFGY
jgi:Ser/Thr protein kinase RdoA (MazF antagonist)